MINENLTKVISDAGITGYKLSKLSGVSETYIRDLTSGRIVNPGIKIVDKLCKTLGIKRNDLLGNEEWIKEEIS